MSVAPHSGIIDFGTFESPTGGLDGKQGEVPAPLIAEAGYFLSTNGWTNNGSGTVTSVAATVPSFLSVSGSPITTSGTLALTYSGTALPVANGGTGVTTLTANYIPYGNGTNAFQSSANLTFDGVNITIKGTALAQNIFNPFLLAGM